MNLKKTLLLVASFIFVTALQAQKLKLKQGDIGVLKGLTSINVEFTYDNLSVGKMTEAEYVKKKTEDYNEKESGKGDKWAEAWVADRKRAYEPQFLEQFEEKSNIKNDKSAKYTLIFHTTFIEPGFNVGAWRKNAYIDAEVTIVEGNDTTKPIAVISIDNSPGRDAMGVDFDTSWRISEAYAKAGKSLAKFIGK